MKKKGFTLVELLAVIAILAILVIIALPNVLSMFNGAKRDLFLTEAKNLYKESANKYISDNMHGSNAGNIYCKSEKNSKNPLNVDANDIYYYIEKDSMGKTINFVVWNNSGYVTKISRSNVVLDNITNDSITEETISDIDCNNVLDKVGLKPILDKNVSDLTNTSWVLNDSGYEFTFVATALSSANKLSDLPGAKLNFTSNGKQYIGLDSIYLPFTVPGINLDIVLSGNINVSSTTSGFNKINFPFGSTIEANRGVITYSISNSEGAYIPYYQNNGWSNNNDKTINITGGDDVRNQTVINWFKNHGERIK